MIKKNAVTAKELRLSQAERPVYLLRMSTAIIVTTLRDDGVSPTRKQSKSPIINNIIFLNNMSLNFPKNISFNKTSNARSTIPM